MDLSGAASLVGVRGRAEPQPKRQHPAARVIAVGAGMHVLPFEKEIAGPWQIMHVGHA
jgi:hypothetical protein